MAAGGIQTARAAKAATDTIPIVFLVGSDPIRLGLIASLSRPDGNATGVTLFAGELIAKRLAMLREVAPQARLVAAMVNPTSANATSNIDDLQSASSQLGLKLDMLAVATDLDVEAAFEKLRGRGADGLLVGPDPFLDSQRWRIVELAAQAKVPAIYAWREFVEAGGLMSYGSRIGDGERNAALYTARILRGTKPADLPVLQPTRFDLVVNLKTATKLGIEIPASLLARADEVIE
jgi:ABC-type uncharacterized transport system substrate-binding protein